MQEPSPGSPDTDFHDDDEEEEDTNEVMTQSADKDSDGQDESDIVMVPTELNSLDEPLDPQTQARFESDKRAVYKHPLFPLLALLFEKCEYATQCAEMSSSESFNQDIQAFVQHQERDGKPIFSDDPDVDGLMVKAIQVLRIHLLELEKVQELCKDFCNRYITCLKNKMQSENLLRTEYPGIPSNGDPCSSPSSNSSSPHSFSPGMNSNSNGSISQGGDSNTGNSFVNIQPRTTQSPVNSVSMATVGPNQIVSGCKVYQMVQTPQGIVAQPIQIQTSGIQPQLSAHVVHGSTPLSQIGSTVPPLASNNQRIQPIAPRTASLLGSGDEDDEDNLSKNKKQKRGVLPKHATSIMKSWLFQHLVHPYPTEDEKRQLATQTNLTLLQVNNWFINARRRILQPMLDSSSNESSHKAKKPKNQSSRCVQRFWPESIASIQPQVPSSASSAASVTASASSTTANANASTAKKTKHTNESEDRFIDHCSSDGAILLDSNCSLSPASTDPGSDESLSFNDTNK